MLESCQVSDTAIRIHQRTPYLPSPINSEHDDLPAECTEFKKQIDSCCEEIVHWKKNIFEPPTCKIGREFVKELSTWLEHFNTFIVTFIVHPALLEPPAKSKTAEHKVLLKKRIELWRQGNISALMREARTIQRQLARSSRKQEKDCARTFANLMFEGKVSSAVRMLCDNDNKGILEMSTETMDQLLKKHQKPMHL